MAKFSNIAKGRRARKPVALELRGERVELDVRVLGPDDDIAIAAKALAGAKAQGVDDPCPGDPIYDAIARVETLLRACIDHASPEERPEPFFASFDEIAKSEDITRDHVAWLYEEQARWQDACSPRALTLSRAEYIAAVARSAEGDIGPFAEMRPGLQWSFVRTMANQLWPSLTDKSPSSSPSAASSPTN